MYNRNCLWPKKYRLQHKNVSICIWVWVSIFSLVVCRLIRCKFWGKIYQLVFVQCYFFLLWPTYGWPDMINRSMIWDLIFILTKMDKLKRSVINNWIIIVLDILNQLSLLCKMLYLVNSFSETIEAHQNLMIPFIF